MTGFRTKPRRVPLGVREPLSCHRGERRERPCHRGAPLRREFRRVGSGLRRGACACGDTIRGEVRLVRDLTGCEKVGLRLESGATLDCDGHRVEGLGPKISRRTVSGSTGSREPRCAIATSAASSAASGCAAATNRVRMNQLEDNVYGVDVAGATRAGTSRGHAIEADLIRSSGMDGVPPRDRQRAGDGRRQLDRGSRQEGLYLQWCDACVATGNTIRGARRPRCTSSTRATR